MKTENPTRSLPAGGLVELPWHGTARTAIRRHRLACLVGEPGAGKSELARDEARRFSGRDPVVLERACREGLFVPWRHVYVDSGVSGTTAARPGYQCAKAAMRNSAGPRTLYVDDLSRLTRDMAELIGLCRDLVDAGRRVAGASDGVDTDSAQYKALVSVSGLVNEWYVDSLKQKVRRGMDDGFRRGKNLRPPAFGYALVLVIDGQSRPVLNAKRRQVAEVVVDWPAAEIALEVFRRYAAGGQSSQHIARWLNGTAAGGRRNWGPSQVLQMLDRRTYAGIEVEGMSRQVRNRESGTVRHVKRERSQRKVRRSPLLRIVPWRLWNSTRARRDERKGLFPKGSAARVEAYPTRLLTLVCGVCGARLTLGKAGKYAQARCPNAAEGKHGCTLRGYKSLRKVEGPVLAWIVERLSDPATVGRIVAEANAAIAEMARAPRPDLDPLEERVRELKAASGRLTEAIAASTAAVAPLAARLEANERELAEAWGRLAEARRASAAPPEPLTAERVRELLSDLRDLLAGEAPVAAPVLRDLLGDIVVAQSFEDGREKPVWHASFRCDALRAVARRDAKPGSDLSRLIAGVDASEPIRLRLDPPPAVPEPKAIPPYVRVSDDAVRLRDEGHSFKEIGERLGVHEVTATRAYDRARPGERPPKGTKRPQGGKALSIRRRVEALLTEGLSPPEAASRAGCSAMTGYRVRRAMADGVASPGMD